jgi:hypothetical protein
MCMICIYTDLAEVPGLVEAGGVMYCLPAAKDHAWLLPKEAPGFGSVVEVGSFECAL